ncbi:MAG TPA: FAD-dependent oxidoreductase [Acidimicrobiales bacterium]|nr:FAD-dependent oxidoreductase [Acidimicrobiales bacterium]
MAGPPGDEDSDEAGVPVTDDPALATLTDSELALLDSLGRRRQVAAGEYLYHEGDLAYDFYVVISGEVEIVVRADGEDRMLARHGPGRFLGELNLLTGLRVFVSARVTSAGEVLAIPPGGLRDVLATQPGLSDKILAAFMSRRASLLTGASFTTRVLGSRFSPESVAIREFLARTRVPHEWLDADVDPHAESIFETFAITPGDLPVVIASGTVLRQATPGIVSEYLGLTIGSLPERCFDLVIAGSGPAGLAAAVYGASEGLRTLCVDMTAPGGQAGASSRIENYFGFPTGIPGADLTQRGLIQAEKFGAHLSAPCAAASLREEAGHLVIALSDGTLVGARAVIVATGAQYRRLDVDRLRDFENRGVFYAATEDEARLCADRPVVVVGGGNSAGQGAMFLAEQGNPVTVVIRGPDLSAGMSRYLVDRLERHPRIAIETNTQIVELLGDDDLAGLRTKGSRGDSDIECAALFSFIGADPQSQWISGCAALDSRGFVLTDRALDDAQLGERWDLLGRRPLSFETSHPGLFAVGDVRSGSTKRVAAAVGEGSASVRSVHEHLAFGAR